MRALYGVELPALDDAISAALPGAGRLRLLADPDGTRARGERTGVPRPRRESLEPVTVPGGLGAHKWRDRRWLDALSAAVAPAQPLLVDLDGYVLEAANAAVLIVDDGGTLIAPPLDGRILPSVTRELALEQAHAAGTTILIRPVRLEELTAAREVILASAVRGIRRVPPSRP